MKGSKFMVCMVQVVKNQQRIRDARLCGFRVLIIRSILTLSPFFIIMVFYLTLFIILSFVRNVTFIYKSIETSFDMQ